MIVVGENGNSLDLLHLVLTRAVPLFSLVPTCLARVDLLCDRPDSQYASYVFWEKDKTSTYGHSQLKTGHPVRSAIHKQLNGRLVLRWVTTWESLLLYVLCFSFYLLSL
jgi:hypothetical protein